MTSVAPRDLRSRLASQRMLVIGDLMLDECITGACSRVSSEAPVPVVQFSASHAVPGGAANTAGNAAALGCSVVLLGQLGEDDAGRALEEASASRNVRLIPIRDGRRTTRKVRVVAHQQQLLRLDYDSEQVGETDRQDTIIRTLEAEVPEADIVVVSDYAKGFLTEAICQRVIALAHQAGKKVIIDPRPQHAAFYRQCDYITPNWREAQALLGARDVSFSEELVASTARQVADRLECSVVLTLGAHGIGFFGRPDGEHFTVSATAKEVFDVSGAGDTVVAVFAAALAAGCDHREAVTLANSAAGVVVGRQGTATIAPDDLFTDELRTPRPIRREELAGIASSVKADGKRLVTINGAFDMLHAGHIAILQQARDQGDVLLVGLNSDESVRMHKGPNRPIISQADRASMLLALRCVDFVHIFDEPTPNAFLEVARPDVHVNGAEYGLNCVEADTVRRGGGRLHLVERTDDRSTSGLIGRIVTATSQTGS